MKKGIALCLWIFLFLFASSVSTGPSSHTGFAASSAVEVQALNLPTFNLPNLDSFSCSGQQPSPPAAPTPNTMITSGPLNPSDSTDAAFVFSCSTGDCTYDCQLDSLGWSSCTSPQGYSELSLGQHIFQVRARDSAGNLDPTPASYYWMAGLMVVSIPAGCFEMGDTFNVLTEDKKPVLAYPTEHPVHNVCISAFQMDIYEVSNARYKTCVDAGVCTAPSQIGSFSRPHYYDVYSNHPVLYVDWNQSKEYCEWAGGRLPTEAEWEYAARGGLAGKRFPWGDTISCADANYHSNALCGFDTQGSTGFCTTQYDTTRVGSYAHNGYGLYDMTGNVDEVVNDWLDPDMAYYSWSPTNDPQGPESGNIHAMRGGNFLLGPPDYGRVSKRGATPPTWSSYSQGFRCAYACPLPSGTPPETTITSGPLDFSYAPDAAFEFNCSEGCCTYDCRLDAGDWTSCHSIKEYTGLTVGSHTFEVKASDSLGNADPTPASYTWTTGVTFVTIPAGCFEMGDPFNEGSPYEIPVHQVCITSDFQMSIYLVTNAQYKACVDAGSCTTPGYNYSGTTFPVPYFGSHKYDTYPVIFVNWSQAEAYCGWIGGRLPTEAEWEYAARGGLAGKRFPWGDTISCADANYFSDSYFSYDLEDSVRYCAGGDTAEVGSYAANGYGLYDMAGNLFEWVNDWWATDYYSSSPINDPTGPSSGTWRVRRNGAFNQTPKNVRAAFRSYGNPTYQDSVVGFRCVR